MQTLIKGRNLEVSEALRSYVEGKAGKLDRYMSNIDEARFDLSLHNARNAEERHIAQITLRTTNGAILRAEEHSADMHASIDQALDKITRQLKRYKGKHWQSQARAAEQAEEELFEDVEPLITHVVRTKRFQMQPMSVDEAIEQMEMLGHDFFIFYDVENGNYSVVYRRRDNGYGLLIPELA